MNKIDSLYLHFPFCAHLCNYCDFFKRVSTDKAFDYAQFHQFLENSFEEHELLIKKHGYCFDELETLYIGGGTPSLWGIEGAIYLKKFLDEKGIKLSQNCEFTLEVNPKTWNEEVINTWKSIGVNRFSIGVQSLNGNMIKYLDRFHTIDDVYDLIKYFSENNENFSMDFMLGLPFSNEEKRNVKEELEIALTYQPKHFSVYILTVKDNYPHFNKLPDEDFIHDEYMTVAEMLNNHGYRQYEVSNFAIPGFESQHNLNYWRSKTVAALGPSATGLLTEARCRYKWKVNRAELEVENLTEEEFRLEAIYMGLRSIIGLDISLMKFNTTRVEELVTKWKNAKFIESFDGNKIVLNQNGFLMLDSLMNDIFLLEKN